MLRSLMTQAFHAFANVEYYNITNNIQAAPAIAGCRVPGCVVVRIFAPMHDPEPPELATPDDKAVSHSSHLSSIDKRTRQMGESGILTHNIDAKLADIAATAARIGRSLGAASARGPGAEILIRYARRPSRR